MRRSRLVLLGLSAAAALAVAAPAHGAVTIGNKLVTGTLVNGPCNASACTVTTHPPTGTSTVEAPGGLRSPIKGVITSWRFASDSTGNQVSLRVLRPAGGVMYTGAGTSTQQTSTAGINGPFLTQLPIQVNDGIGLNASAGALILRLTAEASSLYWNPPLPDGVTLAGTNTGRQTMVEATVEPDVDCDGKGDDTQDPNLTDGPCKSLPKQTLSAKKKQTLKKASISATIDKASTLSVKAKVKGSKSSKTSTTTVAAGATTKIKLAFSAKAKKAIKAAIAAKGPRKVKATVTATDTFGNVSTSTVGFKLTG